MVNRVVRRRPRPRCHKEYEHTETRTPPPPFPCDNHHHQPLNPLIPPLPPQKRSRTARMMEDSFQCHRRCTSSQRAILDRESKLALIPRCGRVGQKGLQNNSVVPVAEMRRCAVCWAPRQAHPQILIKTQAAMMQFSTCGRAALYKWLRLSLEVVVTQPHLRTFDNQGWRHFRRPQMLLSQGFDC